MNKKLADEIGKAYVRLHCKRKENKMIEILECKPATSHVEIIKTLNAFENKVDSLMNGNASYDIDMETDVITVFINFITIPYAFKGELHTQTLTDLINEFGITYTANQLYTTVRHLIINEIYLKIFQKPIDE